MLFRSDLFPQPEVLFFLAALAIASNNDEFVGSPYNPKSLPKRIESVLGCRPQPANVLAEAAKALRRTGLSLARAVEDRLLFAATAIQKRITEGESLSSEDASVLRTPALRELLRSHNQIRRVFPQQVFHMLLTEAEADTWDTGEGRGQTAMFHLGALSGLITAIETPGWTSAQDFKWQVIEIGRAHV